MRVIGAGVCRTGTSSLQEALRHLGIAPAYAFDDLLDRPGDRARWETGDYPGLLSDHAAALDYPAFLHWREIFAVWPDALVILTLRGAEAWEESARTTVFDAHWQSDQDPQVMRAFRRDFGWWRTTEFERHNASVECEAPTDRFLRFDVRDGWAPLCSFLGLPMPARSFPHESPRSAWERVTSPR